MFDVFSEYAILEVHFGPSISMPFDPFPCDSVLLSVVRK